MSNSAKLKELAEVVKLASEDLAKGRVPIAHALLQKGLDGVGTIEEDGRTSDKWADDVQKNWSEFWEPIVAPKGIVDLELIKLELSDYRMMLNFVPRVYDHVTGGRISKPNTDPDVVCSVADDYRNDLINSDEEEDARRLAKAVLAAHGDIGLFDEAYGIACEIGGSK